MLSPERVKTTIRPNKKIYFISPRVLANQSNNYYSLKANNDAEMNKRFDSHLCKNIAKRKELKDLEASLIF